MSTNLLTGNQATGTDTLAATTGWTASACTLASSTTVALEQSRSLQMTATSTANMFARTPSGVSGVPVAAGETYHVEGNARKDSGSAVGVSLISILWYQSNGTASAIRAEDYAVGALNSTGWSLVFKEAVAPADAAYARVDLSGQSSVVAGDIVYWDQIGLWVGTGGTWEDPDAATNFLTITGITNLIG